MSPKSYQVITIQGDSKGMKKLRLNRENNNGSGYLHEKNGTLSLPQDPAPSSLLLQGERGSSRSSSELSSLEGVSLVGKGEKVRENERK